VVTKCPFCNRSLRVPDGKDSGRADSSERAARPAHQAGLLLPPNTQHTPKSAFFVKDHSGQVTGPYSVREMKRMLREQQLGLTWMVSTDRIKWCMAGKAQGLSAELEEVITANRPGATVRSLARAEVASLFVQLFVLQNDTIHRRFPAAQHISAWWAKLTRPKAFLVANMAALGVRYVKYDARTGEAQEVDEEQVDKAIAKGVTQTDWLTPLLTLIGLAWVFWTCAGCVFSFSLEWAFVKAALFLTLVLGAAVYRLNRLTVYVGYTFAENTKDRWERIAAVSSVFQRCGQVRVFQDAEAGGRPQWKTTHDESFKVDRLPVVQFRRSIPNMTTNVRVHGIAYTTYAIYFLPDAVLVANGSRVESVRYPDLRIRFSSFDYVRADGTPASGSPVVGKRWKYSNLDGSPDQRFKSNKELPVVRCGILRLDMHVAEVQLMISDPEASEEIAAILSAS